MSTETGRPIAEKNSWKTSPMPEKYSKIKLKVQLTSKELEKLKKGHIPEEMEDKWFMYYQDGKLYCHRSWTGFCIYIVDIPENGMITNALVNRDSEQYKCTDDKSDVSAAEFLIFSLAERQKEAKQKLFDYVKSIK